MSEYLDNCESYCTSMSVHLTSMNYILEEFHSEPDLTDLGYIPEFVKDNGEKIIQLMFDKASIKMRMYGSAKELAENVKIFKTFPGSISYNRIPLEPYCTTPTIYHSLNNKKLICKSDLFVILQSMITRSLPPHFNHLAVVDIIAYYLKSREKQLNGCLEFVPFEVLEELWESVKKLPEIIKEATLTYQFAHLMAETSTMTHEQVTDRLESSVLNKWEPNKKLCIGGMVEGFHINMPQHLIMSSIATAIVTVNKATILLEELVDTKSEWFMPSPSPTTVRLFEDGDQKFVMKAELFKILKINYTDPRNIYETIPMTDVLAKYQNKLSNVQFIRYPIQRAKHRAVPICGASSTDRSNYCTLAVDAFFEYIRYLIFGYKLFQRCPNSDFNLFRECFERMEEDFLPNHKSLYLLREMSADSVRYIIRFLLSSSEGFPVKNVRNAKSDGFTVQNLKNELAYLNLTTIFPEIRDHAEVVHAHVDRVKKEKYLRTCDLMDALEYCQLICIFERLPNYKKFLHNQGGCGRVPGLKCQLCDEKKKNDEEQTVALKVDGSEISEIESNSQTTAKAVTSSEKSDSISSEVLKVTMGAPDSQLTELNAKIASLEAQLVSQTEKSAKIESDLLKKTKENEELHLSNIKLQSENEANKGVISQLIDKLSIKGTIKESSICLN